MNIRRYKETISHIVGSNFGQDPRLIDDDLNLSKLKNSKENLLKVRTTLQKRLKIKLSKKEIENATIISLTELVRKKTKYISTSGYGYTFH